MLPVTAWKNPLTYQPHKYPRALCKMGERWKSSLGILILTKYVSLAGVIEIKFSNNYMSQIGISYMYML